MEQVERKAKADKHAIVGMYHLPGDRLVLAVRQDAFDAILTAGKHLADYHEEDVMLTLHRGSAPAEYLRKLFQEGALPDHPEGQFQYQVTTVLKHWEVVRNRGLRWPRSSEHQHTRAPKQPSLARPW